MILQPKLHGGDLSDRSETLTALVGSNDICAAELIVLAALWHDDLASQFTQRIKAKLFRNNLRRTIAAYSIGNLLTWGCNDFAKVEQLLRLKFADQAVAITTRTIHTLVDLIDASDVLNALALLNSSARSAA